MSEDNDTVIKEIDVYLSKLFINSFYVLQYPIRPSNLNYSNLTFLEARMKPKQKKMEIHIALNTHCQNYDESTGEKWASDVDGKDSILSSHFYKTDKMDKQILSSSNVEIDYHKYCIASLQNSEFCLVPLDGFLQLRPNLTYIDRMDARKMKNKKVDAITDNTLTALLPRYAPKENEEDRSKRLASYEFLCINQDDEKWISIKPRPSSKVDKNSLRNELFAKRNFHNSIPEFYMPMSEYLDQLLPSLTIENKLNPLLPSNVVSMADIKLKSVADQVKILLECAKVMRFEKFVSFLPKDCDIISLLRHLQQVGMLVQGCWVYKSELLYNGENSETLCRVRDFVLWSFTHYKSITRKDMTNIAKLPVEDEKELLTKIAKRRLHSRDWEFIMHEDSSFVLKNPDIVQRQARLWEKKHAQIMSFIKDKKSLNLKQPNHKSGDLLSDNDIADTV